MKIVEKIKLKIVIFTAMKNRCILHGHVFVMLMACNLLGLQYNILKYCKIIRSIFFL